MDAHLRAILRDPYSSIDLCYQHLLRANYSEDAIKDELTKAGKIPIYGGFEDFQIRRGLLSLEDARQTVADLIFINYDFAPTLFATWLGMPTFLYRRRPITWTSWSGRQPFDNLSRTVYLDTPRGIATATFSITFKPNSAVPCEITQGHLTY